MFTAIHWMKHTIPNEGARESTQGAEGVCSPLGGLPVTLELPVTKPPIKEYTWWAPTACVAEDGLEDGLVGHQWEESPWSYEGYKL